MLDWSRPGYDREGDTPLRYVGSASEGEHPGVTLQKLLLRPRPQGHVIVFANEKGGVGKSTLAFHCAVALGHAGAQVAVIDLDRRQQSLTRVIENRERTGRCLKIDLPCPHHAVLQEQNGAQLSQEIARIGSNCDFVIVDAAGHDSPVARYAIALADTLVTPINSSYIDLDLLGKFDPVNGKLKELGHFARLVVDLHNERIRLGLKAADWIVAKNRVRRVEKNQQTQIRTALRKLAPVAGFRVSEGLSERVVYRELFPFGLTHIDLKRIPGLATLRAPREEEITQFMADLGLPFAQPPETKRIANLKAKVGRELAQKFSASLHAHAFAGT